MEDFHAELSANTRSNSLRVYLDGIFFGLGLAPFYPFTILPGFLTHFSKDPLVINGVVAIYSLGIQGTQLITSWLFDSRQQKTSAFLKSSMLFRLAATPFFLLAYFSAIPSRLRAPAALFVPAREEWIAKVQKYEREALSKRV